MALLLSVKSSNFIHFGVVYLANVLIWNRGGLAASYGRLCSSPISGWQKRIPLNSVLGVGQRVS